MLVCSVCGKMYLAPVAGCAECGADAKSIVPKALDPHLGKTIGKYRVEEFLGAGAVGRVYRVRKTDGSDGDFALKMLTAWSGPSKSATERFRREVVTLSRLQHPNVVSVVDAGETPDGITYLVMEYVEGRTLADAIYNEAPFSVRRAACIAAAVADGLDEAHCLGFVHRDVKPSNVLLVRDGDSERVKLFDFGIVGMMGDELGPALTGDGSIIGTPKYMSPEQSRGDKANYSADIYAVGVMLFEMLTGRPPFRGESHLQILVQHVRALPLALPPCGGLEKLVAQLLEKEPEDRPESCQQVVREIERILRDMPDDIDPDEPIHVDFPDDPEPERMSAAGARPPSKPGIRPLDPTDPDDAVGTEDLDYTADDRTNDDGIDVLDADTDVSGLSSLRRRR